MRNLWTNGVNRWSGLGTAGRVWWTGATAVALAAVLAFGTTTIVHATGHSTPPSSAAAPGGSRAGGTAVTGATTAGSGSMPGMAGMPAGAPGADTGSVPSSTASTACPNVHGATVMSNGMVMAPVPSGSPTDAQQAGANQLVAETTATLQRYASVSAATAAGYVPATNPNGRVVHYMNWQVVRSADVLDPARPSALVFANTVSGPVLLGAMYMGAGPCQPGPDVGGPLTQWHAHDNLCVSANHQVVGNTDVTGACTTGTHSTSMYFMLHVWTAPSLAATHQFQADLTRSLIAPIIRSGQA
ncbi:MAG TPA: hypothetical protein VNG12_15660 [Acidimicrobiales bacterium]|nr:hypothetical protein [Acidimicrobiales bacterium]